MEQNNFDIKKVKVYRTKEATVFEIVFVLMAIIVWALIISMVYRAPDIVPTHFDASGKPNAYGSPVSVTFPCMLLTIGAPSFLWKLSCLRFLYTNQNSNLLW